MNKIALGCSHTYGTGVEKHEAWPALLGAENLGIEGISTDYIARNINKYLEQYKPSTVYILWPDWTRFEYTVGGGGHFQSLPTDKNRIHFMATATDEWLQNNFIEKRDQVIDACKDIELIDMTLYDLHEYIDYPDRWPLSKLGHHYSEVWHQWVADLFNTKAKWINNHRLFA